MKAGRGSESSSSSTYQGKFMSHCKAGGWVHVCVCVCMCVSENHGWVAPSEPIFLGPTHSLP